ncbi:hypothetical protein [Saccharothrix luteola]|uniref:hypothetical protein n=1 Tax=Saccharothrix luteola TaxID=2893018 RepID=UPI001E38F60A|nr:hypothetical protein [Saccharothrix luteola]MCC8246800.1 hypothetical protein [Saccharothrix luteola]
MVTGPAESFTPDQPAELYDVNVPSTQRVYRTALPGMLATLTLEGTDASLVADEIARIADPVRRDFLTRIDLGRPAHRPASPYRNQSTLKL